MDPSLTVGVPQMGGRDLAGKFLENQQLAPDVMAVLRPEDAAAGRDTQLEAAVKVLLEQLSSKPGVRAAQ
jgi:C-terminal processing protease CtpA/Prc